MTAYHEIIRRLSRPLAAKPAGEPPHLRPLPKIRAVLFNVYGTLFVSARGDIGLAAEEGDPAAFEAAFRANGFKGRLNAEKGVECFLATVRAHRAAERQRGTDCPDVDVVEVWRDCLLEMTRRGWMDAISVRFDMRQLAVEYETRINGTWPMPDLLETLERLRASGVFLGIVTNAQFFTLEMIRGLLGKTPEELGFDPHLQFFSYRYMRMKPAEIMYLLAGKTARSLGVEPRQVLHVGNDMLDDVTSAGRAGFRTALFAGDARSLRRRTGDPRVRGTRPDVVVTDLRSICECVLPG